MIIYFNDTIVCAAKLQKQVNIQLKKSMRKIFPCNIVNGNHFPKYSFLFFQGKDLL